MNANTTPDLSEFIFFKPQKFNDTYEVTLAFNEQLIATYNMSVKFMGYKKKLSVIELNRTNEIINEAASAQNNATELAKKCGEILYPVELWVDERLWHAPAFRLSAEPNRYLSGPRRSPDCSPWESWSGPDPHPPQPAAADTPAR